MARKQFKVFPSPMAGPSPEDQGFKSFVITQPHGVELPGCIAVHEVQLGHGGRFVTIPEFVTHKVPTDTTDKNFEEIDVYNWQLMPGASGVPVLVRGHSSNDGVWQVGSTVLVKGDFQGEGTSGTSDELDGLTKKELLALCAEKSIDANDKMSNEALKSLLRASATE